MDLATLTAILGRFGTGLSQHARLITLTSAHDVTLPDAPLAERVRGREAVNDTYRFDVDALSTSTDLDLSGFIGEELTTTLLQPDGTRRAWHGICTAAEWLGADGGVARYRLRLEPALALLRLRRDSYIFQNKNVEGIVSELFADYPQLRFEFDVTQDMPARAICTQYRESDYDFFVRLLASEGLSWRFEHDQDDVADDGQARHRLVIFDGAAAFPDTSGNPLIRFHGMRATDSDDAIDAFRARRRVQANAISISSWAPGQLVAPAAEQEPYLDAGEVPVAQVYDGAGERIATDSGAAERISRLMLQALELDNKLFEGEGAVRRLAAGHAFALTQHDRYPIGENAFKVVWVEHEARNNVGAQIATADIGDIEPGTYRNRFGCVRSVVPVVPRATALPNPHTALGPQTALVVGLPDSVATTTRDHQVRVQFAWQRGAGGNPGSPYHDTDADGCAPGDDRSGTWVRVAEALAGPNWGSQFTPRVGTEVLVDFIENDIDRPLVVAQLYTGPDAPPFAAGVDSGVDHAGTISGIHTQTFDGAGWNQWQLDDTPGQLRMRLATSMAATQLNLGHLVHQPAGSARRGTYRGSGFELRTDAWGVVRGGDGVLLTTSTRQGLGASVASTQMDAAEALGSLKAAQSLDKVLRDSAKAQNALSSGAAAQAQQDFIAQLDPTAQGKFAGPVNGHAAAKAASGSRELDAGAPVERFGKPVVLMDSQAGINWATPASTVLFAGQQLHWTTQADMHMTAAHTLSSVSAEATTLYAEEGGIQAIAANGPVSLQAHTDQLEILADKEVTVISVNDGIEVKAAKKIVLQAGQASVTLEGGNITFACPGMFSVKGAQHPFEGGGRAGAKSEALPGELIASGFGPSTSQARNPWKELNNLGSELANGERLAALSPTTRVTDFAGSEARPIRTDPTNLDGTPITPIVVTGHKMSLWEKVESYVDDAANAVSGIFSSNRSSNAGLSPTEVKAIVAAGQDPDAVGNDFRSGSSSDYRSALNPDDWNPAPERKASLLEIAQENKQIVDGLSDINGWRGIYSATNNFLADSSFGGPKTTPLTADERTAALNTVRSTLGFLGKEVEPMVMFGMPEASIERSTIRPNNVGNNATATAPAFAHTLETLPENWIQQPRAVNIEPTLDNANGLASKLALWATDQGAKKGAASVHIDTSGTPWLGLSRNANKIPGGDLGMFGTLDSRVAQLNQQAGVKYFGTCGELQSYTSFANATLDLPVSGFTGAAQVGGRAGVPAGTVMYACPSCTFVNSRLGVGFIDDDGNIVLPKN